MPSSPFPAASRSRSLVRFAAFLFLLLALSMPLHAADPSAKVELSQSIVEVGEPVQLDLKLEGAGAGGPPAINVEGLEIQYRGQSSQFQMINGDVSRSMLYSYLVVPRKEGSFTIPALEVEVGGQKVSTQPVTLKVQGGGTGSGGQQEPNDNYFAEIRVEKKTGYVGESIPVEVRIYILGSVVQNGAQLSTAPKLLGDGFVSKPFLRPSQRQMDLAGKTYLAVSFHTVITPGKAGKITLSGAPIPLVVPTSRRANSMFDLFPGRGGQGRQVQMTVPPLEVEIKPLPAEGKPVDFTGAIGKFQFRAEGSPSKVNIGQPLEMKLIITGEGSFDRIREPQLADSKGWQTYPASEDFHGSDDLGITGTKTFKQSVVPQTKKDTMPSYRFSYFEPEQGKYFTLTNAPVPLIVEGVEPAPTPATTAGAGATPRPEAEKPREDLVGNAPQLGPVVAFGLPGTLSVFIRSLLLPLPLLLGLAGWRARRTDPARERKASLRKQKAELLGQVRQADDRAVVLDAAAHVLQIEMMLATGQPLNDVEVQAVTRARKLDTPTVEAIEWLFAERAASLYMGGGRDGAIITPKERDRLLESLASFERSPIS